MLHESYPSIPRAAGRPGADVDSGMRRAFSRRMGSFICAGLPQSQPQPFHGESRTGEERHLPSVPFVLKQRLFHRGLWRDDNVDLAHEFFQGFVNHAQVTLHVENLRGDNAHHQCETVFKAFARALRMAVEPDPRAAGVVPSTKGSL